MARDYSRYGEEFARRYTGRDRNTRELDYTGPYGGEYRGGRRGRRDIGEAMTEGRPYRRSPGAQAWPETGRGLTAGGRQGPGRAWGMGGHPELNSESGRYDQVGFGEDRTPGMGGSRGGRWSLGMAPRTSLEGTMSGPGRTIGAGPIATDSLRGGGRGMAPMHRGDEGHGHPAELEGTRYLYERAHRDPRRGMSAGGYRGQDRNVGAGARATYGEGYRSERGGRGDYDTYRSSGRGGSRVHYRDRTEQRMGHGVAGQGYGGTGYGAGYRR